MKVDELNNSIYIHLRSNTIAFSVEHNSFKKCAALIQGLVPGNDSNYRTLCSYPGGDSGE